VNTVEVKPALIRWARERSGLAESDLAERFPKLELWQRGEASPTLRQLEAYAKKTLTPFGYFFLPEPPDEKLPIPDFRTVRDRGVRRPSPNLLESIYTMQRRQDWMREYLVEEGAARLPFVGSVTLESSQKDAARRIREAIGMTAGWAREHSTWTAALLALRRATEAIGIIVVINSVVGNSNRRKLDPDEFQGFILSDPYSPLIFINGADFKSAQMFTLAHELAHVWLGRDGVFDLPDFQPADNAVERFCNAVAAELLIPAAELEEMWPHVHRVADPFQAVATVFRVSPIVAARRALDLRLIPRAEFFAFLRDYEENERRREGARKAKKSGGDFYLGQEVKIGRRFGEAVIRAARAGRLLYRDAYRLTGLHGQTFDRFAEGLGFALPG
jgi:Zn-dependent peptidase ImmA (M78 family)/transcriptional regulator with XRE-family HTH domain